MTRRIADKAVSVIPEMKRHPGRIVHRRGTCPLKNESGMIDTVSSLGRKDRRVSAGNGPCIAAKMSSNLRLGARYVLLWKSNIRRRVTPESMSIVTRATSHWSTVGAGYCANTSASFSRFLSSATMRRLFRR